MTSGQAALITGPTGSGKTTLLRCIGGIIPGLIEADFEGEILWKGRRLNPEARTNGSPRIYTVLHNPFHAALDYGVSDPSRLNGAGKWLLESMERSRSFHDLSAGERMRLSLARAFSAEADILLLDEPLAHLDRQGVKVFLEMLEKRKRLNRSITIIAEHRREKLQRLTDVKIELNRPVEQSAELDSVDESIQSLFTSIEAQKNSLSNSSPLLNLSDVGMKYNGKPVFSGVNLQIRSGEALGITGPNGSGKSTLGRIIGGNHPPSQGSVTTRNGKPRTAALFENPATQFLCDTVEDEIHFARRNFGVPKPFAAALMEVFGLIDCRRKSPLRLSHGQGERTAAAAALAGNPDLIVLDEPTQGQDSEGRERLAQLIKALSHSGKAVVTLSHDVEFLIESCDRVLAFRDGSLETLN